MPKHDYTQGPTPQERGKQAMIQGAWLLAIGGGSTAAAYFFCGVWFLLPVIAAIGLFRFLYGLVVWTTGWE
jgi:hypothetical protein